MKYKKKTGTIERNCVQCDQPFKINLQDSYAIRRKICSEECIQKRRDQQYEEFIIRRRIKKGLSLEGKCPECGKTFLKGTGRGQQTRVYCSDECLSKKAKRVSKEYIEKRKTKAGVCKVIGCRGLAVREKYTVCEAHYCMHRRTGSYEGKIRNHRVTDGKYVRIIGKGSGDHPIASKKSKILYEHRMVAYDSRNGICEPCFWCGTKLDWENCVIDHLNEDKHDNRPDNLLIACTNCNRARGALLDFIFRMKESSVPVFYEAIIEYRKKRGK